MKNVFSVVATLVLSALFIGTWTGGFAFVLVPALVVELILGILAGFAICGENMKRIFFAAITISAIAIGVFELSNPALDTHANPMIALLGCALLLAGVATAKLTLLLSEYVRAL